VSEGLLLAPIRPVYPAIARAARVEGTVVVEAVISRVGRIESLRVVSGPEMLRRAALDAIQEARYRPYRLNGEAVDVETTITVNFRMGG
jgi:protein TonB